MFGSSHRTIDATLFLRNPKTVRTIVSPMTTPSIILIDIAAAREGQPLGAAGPDADEVRMIGDLIDIVPEQSSGWKINSNLVVTEK